jgi:hypothetical protein
MSKRPAFDEAVNDPSKAGTEAVPVRLIVNASGARYTPESGRDSRP